jgi:hypothetical protein
MGLADRLRARKPPTETVQLPLDPEAYAYAERELLAATFELEEARASGSADLARLQARVDAAKAKLDECECEEITLRALPPAEWEALLDLHPPTEEQRANGAMWNTTTFRPALLAASMVPAEGEEPLSEADWDELGKAGSLAAGELIALFNAAVGVNVRTPSSAVGKGS